jgi:hypothetical protein
MIFDMLGGFINDWIRGSGRNEISCQTDRLYVSYLDSSSAGEETALVILNTDDGPIFWILLGDHREGYAKAFNGGPLGRMKRMKAYYLAHHDEASPWTEYDTDDDTARND